MKRAQILLFYLVLFIAFIETYTINLTIVVQKGYEYFSINELNRYSIIESEVLIKTVKKFHDYEMEDFTIKTDLGSVFIYYLDETAYIKFDFNKVIHARLDYDLVYDSCYNYELIPEALFPVVDKLNS